MYSVLCYVMFLCGVAVLELDSHPDQNNGPDQRTLRWSTDHPIDHGNFWLVLGYKGFSPK